MVTEAIYLLPWEINLAALDHCLVLGPRCPDVFFVAEHSPSRAASGKCFPVDLGLQPSGLLLFPALGNCPVPPARALFSQFSGTSEAGSQCGEPRLRFFR